MAKITKRAVDEAKPGASTVFIRDDQLRGFGLKISSTGAKSYFVEYRLPGGREAPKGRVVIGRHGSPWTPDMARREAKSLLEGVRKGVDPIVSKREAHRINKDLAFNTYVAMFIELYAKREGLRSLDQMESAFRLHCFPRWNTTPLPAITRRDVSALLNRLAESSPSMARYTHAILHKMFRWAVGRGDLKISPMTDMPPPAPATSRDRVLTDDELIALWKATGEIMFGAAFRLLILTGQRRSEVLGMSFEELDMALGTWAIPAARSKNNLIHIVPLSPQAMAELTALGAMEHKRGLVFTTTQRTPVSGVSKMKGRLDETMLHIVQAGDAGATLHPWRLHDIRRTVATGLQRLGVRFEVTEAVLNHINGAKSGVAGVYQRHDWKDEKRVALEAWGRHVERIVSSAEGSNIVMLPAHRGQNNAGGSH